MDKEHKGKVGIIGSGLIGRSFAMLFASVGYKVSIYDSNPQQVQDALQDIEGQLKKLEGNGLLKGHLSASEQLKLLSAVNDLTECVSGALYIQEAIPERLHLKQEIFAKLDQIVTSDDTILASSTSAIPASKFTETLTHRAQCIVVHPVYPPYYCPLLELIPAPWTNPAITARTKAITEEIGSKPIVFKKEVEGFGVNVIQYAIARACWFLVDEDCLEPDDVDKVLRYGLGMRYAFIGNFETMHLNSATGFCDNLHRYGPSMNEVLKPLSGPLPESYFNPDSATAKLIHEKMCERIPTDELSERRQWRDERLIALAKLKKDMGDN